MTAEARPGPAVLDDARAAAGFDPAESAGVFVGVSRFEDERFAEIPFAVDDAVDLAYLFAVELRLVEPSRVVLALAGEPRKAESAARLEALSAAGARRTAARQTDVYARLEAVSRSARPRGLFVAALATHGFSDQGGDFLVAADSLRKRIVRTGVAVEELFDDVARSRSPRRLVLLDACRERLTAATRALADEPQAAMSHSFADAIAAAEGQVVLAGATLGGFAYDDLERRNGVFTAAVIDGLQGRAPVDERGFITVHTLADYVQERVAAWVRDHRPDHVALSRGIARRVEGAAAGLPLAVDPAREEAALAWWRRREAALARLRGNIGETITGALYDEIAATLPAEVPGGGVEELLVEVEALDGDVKSQRSLAYYFQQSKTEPSPEPTAMVPEPAVEPPVPERQQPLEKPSPFWKTAAKAVLAVTLVVGVVFGAGQLTRYGEGTPADPADEDFSARPVDTRGAEDATDDEIAPEPAPPPSETVLPPPATPARHSPDDAQATQPALVGPRCETNGPGEMRFCWIPQPEGGAFQMGSPPDEPERGPFDERLHSVTLTRPFWMGETEVTQAQWRRVMRNNPDYFQRCDDCPVNTVNWFEAVEFANRLSREAELKQCYELEDCNGRTPGEDMRCNIDVIFKGVACKGYRLPTEAEWEYAARAGTTTPFSTGLNLTTDQAHCFRHFDDVTYRFLWKTVPAKSFEPNDWGLYQVHGNVREWVWDWYALYPSSAEDPIEPKRGSYRVLRGGSSRWDARGCRSARRFIAAPGGRLYDVGFRLARTP